MNTSTFKIKDGRPAFWQWDLDRQLLVGDEICSEVHFCNGTSECSLKREVYELDGERLVDVPDVILQTARNFTVYGYVSDGAGGYTKRAVMFSVRPRTKPADYVYTDDEVKIWDDLDERVKALEENGAGGVTEEQVADVIEEYMAENPVEHPDKLPNPHVLTFTGAVEATYDGSKAVEVVIPQGGGDGEWQTILDDTATVEDVTQIAASLNASKFEEYRAVIFIGKNTNTEAAVNGNVTIYIDGHMVSYYTIANNFDNNHLIVVAHVETSPIVAGLHQSVTGSEKFAHTYVWKTTSPYHSSCAERKDMLCTKKESRAGKLHIEMPAAYFGTVRYKILARK